MNSNKSSSSRMRRARKIRAKIKELGLPRLTVHRTGKYLYAQVISPENGNVIAATSSLQKDVKSELKSGKNREAAAKIGKLIGEKTVAAGVKKVAFDRSGYRYHVRLKALADSAREAGLEF